MATGGKTRTGPNKTKAIQELIAKRPNLATKEVIEQLKATGIEVTANLVYTVRGKINKDSITPARSTTVAPKTNGRSSVGDNSAVDHVRRVKSLANEIGGIDKLKSLVDVLHS